MTINWQSIFADFALAIGGSAGLVLASTWVLKQIINHGLAREIESFKARLTIDTTTAIEKLRRSLQIMAAERQVRFSSLHQKRAEAAAELYKLLVEAFWAAQNLAFRGYSGRPDQKEEYVEAQEKLRKFYIFAETNRIYLPRETCGRIDSLIEALRRPIIALGVYGSIEYPTPDTVTERNKIWLDAVEAFSQSLPAARLALEEEFRSLLGVEHKASDPEP